MTDKTDLRKIVPLEECGKAPGKNCFLARGFSHSSHGMSCTSRGSAFLTNLRRPGTGAGKSQSASDFAVLLTVQRTCWSISGRRRRGKTREKTRSPCVLKIALYHAYDLCEADYLSVIPCIGILAHGDKSLGWYSETTSFDLWAHPGRWTEIDAIFVPKHSLEVLLQNRGGVEPESCFLVDHGVVLEDFFRSHGVVAEGVSLEKPITVAGFPNQFDGYCLEQPEDPAESNQNFHLVYHKGSLLELPDFTSNVLHANHADVHFAYTTEGTSGEPMYSEISGKFYAAGIHYYGMEKKIFTEELCGGSLPYQFSRYNGVNLFCRINDEVLDFCNRSKVVCGAATIGRLGSAYFRASL